MFYFSGYRDLDSETRYEENQAYETLKYSDFPERGNLNNSILTVRDPYLSYPSQLLQYPTDITSQTEIVSAFPVSKYSSSPTHTEIYRPIPTPLRPGENGFNVVYSERPQPYGEFKKFSFHIVFIN